MLRFAAWIVTAQRELMEKFMNWLKSYFTKRNTFKIVVIELQIIGLLLCAVLAMNVQVDLTLQGEPVMTVEKGDVFEDPGAIAMSEGRTVKVKVTGEVDTQTPGTYTLCYRARYLLSSAKTTRTVYVVDTRPPVLTLVGQQTITLTMGSEFAEPGYKATDNNGQDLTARVRVSGEVDPMNPGDYTITYTVTDDAGRTTVVQRIVTVEAAKQPEVVQPDGKVIYLTFDDGPGSYTDRLLEILEKHNVKATFFVVGTNSNLSQRLKAIAEDGHAIGIHTMTHVFEDIYASEEAFLQDLYGMQTVIREHTGITTTLMRFPGGSSNQRCVQKGQMKQLAGTVTNLGFQYFDWNVDSNDAGGAKSAEEIYQNVINGIGSRKTACVLMHDVKGYTVDAIEQIILWGMKNGYSFQVLTPSSPGFHHVEP